MATVNGILTALSEFAPPERKMDFDNVGLLVGEGDTEVTRVLAALDITGWVIEEAARYDARLIVSHHPLFFSLKSVTDGDTTGKKIISLISRGISAICMHTNLDAADGGVNDALASAVGLRDTELLDVEGTDGMGRPYSCGRVGTTDETDMSSFLIRVRDALGTGGVRYHDACRPVRRVCVVGGSGGSMLETAISRGCDTMVTADVKYDVFLEAKERGINLIDADHFCTENVVIPVIRDVIVRAFPEVEVITSSAHGQTARFM